MKKQATTGVSSNQGVVKNVTSSFAPYQLKIDHRRQQNIYFSSTPINLAIRAKGGISPYPVTVEFIPTVLCSINGQTIPNVDIYLEINGVRYNKNSAIIIDDDQYRQYRITITMFAISRSLRGSVLCDVKNGLSIAN